MFNTVLTALLLVVSGGILVALVSLLVFFSRLKREIKGTIASFLTSSDPSQPSPLAQTVEQAAQLVGRQVIAQFKASMMGDASAMARAEKAAITEATKSRYPWLAALSALAPGLTKNLAKNPALLAAAGQLLNKGTEQPVPAATLPGNGSTPERVKFKL
jgi:biopolymer transport protein ExbB/TolQ